MTNAIAAKFCKCSDKDHQILVVDRTKFAPQIENGGGRHTETSISANADGPRDAG